MRKLSNFQSQRCENAKHKTCKCRCKGQLHGARRGIVTRLEKEDPHFVEPDYQLPLFLFDENERILDVVNAA